MQTILHILKRAGGWHSGLSLTIDNAPYMPLVIEALPECGPCGLIAFSVAHYGEQHGDLMLDPEMCFELSVTGDLADFNPFYYRNDYVGCEQWSRFIIGSDYAYETELHRQHVSFAKVWDSTSTCRALPKRSSGSDNKLHDRPSEKEKQADPVTKSQPHRALDSRGSVILTGA